MNKTFKVLFSILVCAIIFSSGVNKSISQIASIDGNVYKTASDTLTVSDIIDVLVSFHFWTDTWTGDRNAEMMAYQALNFISKEGESSVKINTFHDLHDRNSLGSFQTFKVEKPFLKFTYIYDGEERPGKNDMRTVECEIEIISKTHVKIEITLYWPRLSSENKYASGEYIKN